MRSSTTVVICALLLGGCSSSTTVPTGGAQGASPGASSMLASRVTSGKGKIYVPDCDSNAVTVYAPHPTGTVNEAPVGTIAGSETDLACPMGVAVDESGKIYVTTYGGIAVFTANPKGTINEAPIAGIDDFNSGQAHSSPMDVALDASGKVYVANGWNSVTVYAAKPGSNFNDPPIATIAGSNTGLNYPSAIALDASGRIYVANYDSSTITVYAANPQGTLNETPLATIGGSATMVVNPLGVAIDAAGRVVVGNGNAVLVFPANPAGSLDEAPVAWNDEADAFGVAFDASDNLYVSNYPQNSIEVFNDPTNYFSEPPTGTISGNLTQLEHHFGIAVH